MSIERQQFAEFAMEVEEEYQMGGLSSGLYEDFAWDIYQKMIRPEAKKERYRRNMVEKYGENVFKERAEKMNRANAKKSDEWREERASKAGKTKSKA